MWTILDFEACWHFEFGFSPCITKHKWDWQLNTKSIAQWEKLLLLYIFWGTKSTLFFIPVVLNREQSPLQSKMGDLWSQFWLSQLWGCLWHLSREGPEMLLTSDNTQDGLHNRELPVPKANSAQVKNPAIEGSQQEYPPLKLSPSLPKL